MTAIQLDSLDYLSDRQRGVIDRVLAEARVGSVLPPEPRAVDELEGWLIELRRSNL